MKKIEKFTLLPQATIRQALAKIDRSGIGQVFIVDQTGRLAGIATDGDIRRALLKGSTLDSSVSGAVNFKPVYVKSNERKEDIDRLFDDPRIKILPVVDEEGLLLNFIDKYRERTFLPVARPIFQGNELKYVTDAVLSGWVSSGGSYIRKFEKEFADFCGSKYAITSSNGTTALHLALRALGVGPGDEVLVPSFTFIATANAVKYVGATPIFVDIEKKYWQIDPKKIRSAITKKTKVIIPVHLYGHPAKMDDIMRIAQEHDLMVVEDAAEAVGATVNGKRVGKWGHIGVFSFFGNKIITTGEGGMLTTDDSAIAEKLAILRDHGMSRDRRYVHEVLGYNYRMTNLQAALGLAQLEHIDDILSRKIRVASLYSRHLRGIRGLILPRQAPWARSVYWMYSVLLDSKQMTHSRDDIIESLKKAGVDTRPFFLPVHKQPIYSEYGHVHLPVTEDIAKWGLNLPSSVQINESDVKHVSQVFRKILVN